MRFPRAKKGNPVGPPDLPKGIPRQLAGLSEKAAKRLGELLDRRGGAIGLKAAEPNLDRAWGQPALAVGLAAADGAPLADLSDSALERLVQEPERIAARNGCESTEPATR